MKIREKLKRIPYIISNIRKYIREGGVVYTSVAFVNANKRFEEKKVLVTGGTTGIGFEIAKEFLAEGAKVIITARRENRLQEASDILNSENLYTLLWDISDIKNAESKMNEAVNLLQGIDICVNNAGIYDYETWDTCTEIVYDKVLNTNTKGLFFMCQAVGKYFTSTGRIGKIINICSRNSIDSSFDPYTISKWGAACITKGLAKELIKMNVIVNGVAPGNVATNIHGDNHVHSIKDNAYMPSHLTKRWVLVEEVAGMVLYLSSDAANSIVGQIIAVDGGWSLH